jgi:hypothetical protein
MSQSNDNPSGGERKNPRRRRNGPQGGRRPSGQGAGQSSGRAALPPRKPAAKKKPGLIQRLLGIVGLGSTKIKRPSGQSGPARPAAATGTGSVTRTTVRAGGEGGRRSAPPPRPDPADVTSPRLYVGNLSYDASESDLTEVFNGVGRVVTVEIVTNQRTQRSKGYGFIEMGSIEEARRAVAELHDKEYMNRKMVVSGAKPRDAEDDTDHAA